MLDDTKGILMGDAVYLVQQRLQLATALRRHLAYPLSDALEISRQLENIKQYYDVYWMHDQHGYCAISDTWIILPDVAVCRNKSVYAPDDAQDEKNGA